MDVMLPRDEKKLLFTNEHEWVEYDPKTQIGTVGITHFAQDSLGDVVFVEMPHHIGQVVSAKQSMGSVESVKTVSEIFVPLSGTILNVNDALQKTPEWINQDPYGKGWLCSIKVSNIDELTHLLDWDAYQRLVH